MEDIFVNGSIGDIRGALAARKTTVREMTEWYLARIERLGLSGGLNAVRAVACDAVDIARERDEELVAGRSRGNLHGIPVLIKDNIHAGSGLATTAGARALAGFKSERQATLVRRLRAAGAIILGKTNLTEFADYVSDVMPSGFSSAGGTVVHPFTKQGYDRGLGSSVGSAASVAASLAPIAIGSETQNSIQTPASVTSVFGFKPSVGMVSRNGVIPLVPSQDSPGPLARCVDDLHEMLVAVGGPDPRDAATGEMLAALSSRLVSREPGSIRIGVLRRAVADRKDFEAVMPAFEAVLDELRQAGVTIVDPCDLPSAEQLQEVRSCVFRTEFKAALDAFLEDTEWRGGVGSLADIVRWNEAHPDAIPYGQSLLLAALETDGLGAAAYKHDRHRDIVLSRQAGIDAALRLGEADALIAPMGAAAKCTGKAGYPVLAIPAGKDPAGMPFGITLTCGFTRDEHLLGIGRTVAQIVGQRLLPGF
jgi:amidase